MLVMAVAAIRVSWAGPATTQSANRALEATDVPAMKLLHGKPDAHFLAHHKANLKRAASGPVGLLFLGDSITQHWTDAPDVWKSHYGKYDPANFGVDGDRTQHVLWRIDNGELDHISPKVVVLLIGTNNIGWPADQIVRGNAAIVKRIHEKLPDAKVLLLGIFPRGASLSDPNVAKMRDKIKSVNAELAKLDDGDKTQFLDIGQKFVDPQGNISKTVLKDGLHPSPAGYAIWADAMQDKLDQMLK
jgi:beta-glucosidase